MNVLLALTLALGMQGQPQQDSTKTKLLEEVVVTSVRGDAKTPISQNTIKTTDIPINYTGQELPVILSTTPSITWYSDGGHYTGYAYYRLRGVDQTRINVTLNGIPLNEPEDQGAYFSNYPDFINSLKSIQIQRGVGLSTNGTASFVGSINLQSPSLLDTAYTDAAITYGSFDTRRYSLEYNHGLHRKFALYGRLSTVKSQGSRKNSGTDGKSLFLSAGRFGKNSMLKFTGFAGTSANEMAYLAASKTSLENDYRINYLREDEKDLFFQSLLSLEYTLHVNDRNYINTTIYYNRLVGNYDVYFEPDMLNFQLRSNWIGAFINYHYELPNIKVVTGLHVNSYDRNHEMAIKPSVNDELYSNTGIKREASAFIRATYEFEKLSFYADIQDRYVDFKYIPDQAASNLNFNSVNWNFVNPKIGLNYDLTDTKRLYASVGITHREPTRNDMFAGYDNIDQSNYEEIGQFDKVKPEQVIDTEIGIGIKNSLIDLDGNLYYMQFKNEIAAIGQLSYIGLPLRKNVASSYRTGIELNLGITPTTHFSMRTTANLSKNRIKQYTTDYDGQTYYNVNPLLTPSFILNQFLTYKISRFSIGINGRYSSQSFLDNTNNTNFTVPSSFIVNSNITVKIIKGIEIAFDVNNITNQKYYYSGYVSNNESNYFAMATRNYFATLNIKF